MLSTIPQSRGTISKTNIGHWGEGDQLIPCMNSQFKRDFLSIPRLFQRISVPEKSVFNLTYFLKSRIELLEPSRKHTSLLTPFSKFSYSIVTGSHLKNPQQADCFCLCSTGLLLLFLMDFVLENRDVAPLWSQLLFFVELQQEFQ